MPVLGSNRAASSAYPTPNRSSAFRSMMMLFLFLTLMRNVMFKDYRSEAVGSLKASGKSEVELEKLGLISPKSAQDRLAIKKMDYEQMKLEVVMLKSQVQELQEKVGITPPTTDTNPVGQGGTGETERVSLRGGNDPTKSKETTAESGAFETKKEPVTVSKKTKKVPATVPKKTEPSSGREFPAESTKVKRKLKKKIKRPQ
eukprot:CAMPEP_0198281850 /NCGR_PEP_ID=MMETSP1449-20131203/1728_1 /TAXON_ID=420275 /ORGANISM="Attheya septentrionalis, Strain CCMP2084" /LENGTH=200 /DNA_ID=CAMNT_0043977813 /DNA_START=135 /DNA_END=737 /DNA_ORIENTATION=-